MHWIRAVRKDGGRLKWEEEEEVKEKKEGEEEEEAVGPGD